MEAKLPDQVNMMPIDIEFISDGRMACMIIPAVTGVLNICTLEAVIALLLQ